MDHFFEQTLCKECYDTKSEKKQPLSSLWKNETLVECNWKNRHKDAHNTQPIHHDHWMYRFTDLSVLIRREMQNDCWTKEDKLKANKMTNLVRE